MLKIGSQIGTSEIMLAHLPVFMATDDDIKCDLPQMPPIQAWLLILVVCADLSQAQLDSGQHNQCS